MALSPEALTAVEEKQTSVLITIPPNGKLPKGIVPAVALENPAYAHNVGYVVRACANYGLKQVWFSGNRVPLVPYEGYRLPREERFKGYKDVSVYNSDRLFDAFERGTSVIGVELIPNAMPLTYFEHPENSIYLFGPEDGSISKGFRKLCHQIVFIPTKHCLNIAAAVNTVLYDRQLKLQQSGKMPVLAVDEVLEEERGWM